MRGPFLGLSYMVAYVACYGIQNEPSMTKPNFDGIGIAERQEEESCIDKFGDACTSCLGNGKKCNGKTYEKCEEAFDLGAIWCGASCNNDGDCATGEVCLNGGTTTSACATCNNDGDCATGEVCLNGGTTTSACESCMDKFGNACTNCLGGKKKCNGKTYEECEEAFDVGAIWCGEVVFCDPDTCNLNEATGEVCDAGICNCGDAPCDVGQICKAGVCGCADTANGHTDQIGNGCDAEEYQNYAFGSCGVFDTDEFTAHTMCCACKGIDAVYADVRDNYVYYQVAWTEQYSLLCEYLTTICPSCESNYYPFGYRTASTNMAWNPTYYDGYAECGGSTKGNYDRTIKLTLIETGYGGIESDAMIWYTNENDAIQKGPFPN